jgi:type IV pilus assembly protein PilF
LKVSQLTVLGLFALLLVGCQQGTVRPGGTSPDMVDNTGQFSQHNQTGEGDVYVKLAIAYMREGHLDVALMKAKQALSVEPANAEGHNASPCCTIGWVNAIWRRSTSCAVSVSTPKTPMY